DVVANSARSAGRERRADLATYGVEHRHTRGAGGSAAGRQRLVRREADRAGGAFRGDDDSTRRGEGLGRSGRRRRSFGGWRHGFSEWRRGFEWRRDFGEWRRERWRRRRHRD